MLTRMGQQHTNLLVANITQTSSLALELVRRAEGFVRGFRIRVGLTSKLTLPSLAWCSARPPWWRWFGSFNISES